MHRHVCEVKCQAAAWRDTLRDFHSSSRVHGRLSVPAKRSPVCPHGRYVHALAKVVQPREKDSVCTAGEESLLPPIQLSSSNNTYLGTVRISVLSIRTVRSTYSNV